MKQLILFALICTSLFYSCKDDDEVLNHGSIQTHVDLKLNDKEGRDLFDQKFTTVKKDLKVYCLVNNKWELRVESNTGSSNDYMIYQDKEGYVLRLFPDLFLDKLETKMLVKWSDNYVADTIITQYSKYGNGGISNDKVFLNSKLIVEHYPIIIIK